MHDRDLDLNQLLADPLVRLMMSSDGVEETHIRQLAERIAPSQTASRKAKGRRFDDVASTLRHMPSCRSARPCAPSTQPSA